LYHKKNKWKESNQSGDCQIKHILFTNIKLTAKNELYKIHATAIEKALQAYNNANLEDDFDLE